LNKSLKTCNIWKDRLINLFKSSFYRWLMYIFLKKRIISFLNILFFPTSSPQKSPIFGICSTHCLIKDSPSIPCCNWWLVSSSWLFSKMQPTTLRLVGYGFTSESPWETRRNIERVAKTWQQIIHRVTNGFRRRSLPPETSMDIWIVVQSGQMRMECSTAIYAVPYPIIRFSALRCEFIKSGWNTVHRHLATNCGQGRRG